MNSVLALDYAEVVQQRAISSHSLGTDSRASTSQIGVLYLRYQSLEVLQENLSAIRPVDLTHADFPIPESHLPESWIPEVTQALGKTEIPLPISLAAKGHNGVRSSLYMAFNIASKVDTQEWKLRVRHRID